MSTIFKDISKKHENNSFLKTRFLTYLNKEKKLTISVLNPEDFDYVDFLGNDEDYGDTFKAYNKKDSEYFIIFFGTKGLEFD